MPKTSLPRLFPKGASVLCMASLFVLAGAARQNSSVPIITGLRRASFPCRLFPSIQVFVGLLRCIAGRCFTIWVLVAAMLGKIWRLLRCKTAQGWLKNGAYCCGIAPARDFLHKKTRPAILSGTGTLFFAGQKNALCGALFQAMEAVAKK